MSAEEVKVAIGQANRDAYLALYADEAVYHGVGSGIAAIGSYYDAIWTAFPDAHLEVEDVVVEGDRVASKTNFCLLLTQAAFVERSTTGPG